MEAWLRLVHLGDPGFTLPAATALTAWMLAARAWRAAFWWSLLFAGAVGLAAASKVAYLGWGGGWQALCYKALSGHATGASAVFPVLLYWLAGRSRPRLAMAGAGAGLAVGALLAVALVAAGEHSAAEAGAGWCVGALAGAGALALGKAAPPARRHGAVPALALALALGLAGAWLMQWAQPGYWMIRAARLLSGHEHVFKLSID